MNSTSPRSSRQGFSRTELLVVVGIIVILAGLLAFLITHRSPNKPPILNQNQMEAQRVRCVNNLKQVGIAFRVWEGDFGDKYPMAVSKARGGTMEFNTGADTFRHFQVMSNELATPIILVCPADTRVAAADFAQLKNQNVSYFVGLDANDANPQMILSGDRNITGPNKPENGILKLAPGDSVNWTAEMHGNQGNVGLTDGSVQRLNNSGLGEALENTGATTNIWRIALPE